jgi:hypothetical protein
MRSDQVIYLIYAMVCSKSCSNIVLHPVQRSVVDKQRQLHNIGMTVCIRTSPLYWIEDSLNLRKNVLN